MPPAVARTTAEQRNNILRERLNQSLPQLPQQDLHAQSEPLLSNDGHTSVSNQGVGTESTFVRQGSGTPRPHTAQKNRLWEKRNGARPVAERFLKSSPKSQVPSKKFLPITHKAPLLLTVSVACIVLVVLLEVLSRKSARDGAIMFAQDGESLGAGQEFTYLYLPTIIAVIGSMIWGWIDLDVKRLEGFFQLSRPGGASGLDSVLLSYPVDFLALVPITAARRKHYTVVATGIVMCLIFWVITPLQAAIFSTSQVMRSHESQSLRSTGLIPQDTASIDSSILRSHDDNEGNVTEIFGDTIHTFLDTVYAVTWLNQSVPPFTTEGYALAPFLNIGPQALSSYDLVKAPTSLYETDVSCQPANITLAPSKEDDNPNNAHYNITNSQGFYYGLGGEMQGNGYAGPSPAGTYTGYCNVTGDFDYGISTILPTNIQSDAYCGSPNASFTFLALWQNDQKTAQDETKGLIGAFCKPAYYSQSVDVTFFQTNQSIQTITRKGSRMPLDPAVFNISHFENMIATTETINVTNIDTSALISSPSLGYTPNGTVPMVIGIGIGLTSITHAEMPDPGNLGAAVRSAHQLMFAMAAQTQMANNNETVPVQITRQNIVQGVVVVRAFAIVIEVLLAIVAAVAILIFVLSSRRPNSMASDPHSLAAVMALCSPKESEPLNSGLFAYQSATDAEFKKSFGKRKFLMSKTDLNSTFAHLSTTIPAPDLLTKIKHAGPLKSPEGGPPRTAKPARPRALSVFVACLSIFILIVLIIALSVLKALNDRYHGFASPTSNTAVQQILFNYIPTAIGTLIEPGWVYFNRIFAILMPWEELRRGKARFKGSIGADYVSLPPQLLLVRALRSRHFLLAAICVIALLANLLAVAFSGLFKLTTVAEQVNVPIEQQYQPTLQNVGFHGSTDSRYGNGNHHWDYTDPFLVVDANLTRNVSLPGWTTPDYYFLPFNVTIPPDGNDGTQSAITLGFGVDVPCFEQNQQSPYTSGVNFTAIPKNETTSDAYGDASNIGQHGHLNTIHVLKSNGTSFGCYPRYSLDDDSGGDTLRFEVEHDPGYLPYVLPSNQSNGSQVYAVETVVGMDIGLFTNSSGFDEEASCTSELSLSWLRGLGTKNTSAPLYASIVIEPQDSMLLLCYPQLKAANFSVTVDSTSRVVSSQQASPFASEQDLATYYDGPAPRAITETNAMLHGDVSDIPAWHIGPPPSDWLNYFISLEAGSTDLTDPAKALPDDPTTIIPFIERSYRRIFAVALGLNRDLVLLPMTVNSSTSADLTSLPLNGTMPVYRMKWVIVPAMFTIAITILILNLLVAIAIFIYRPPAYLPRLPTSILSQMAFFGSSSVLQEMRLLLEAESDAHSGTEGNERKGDIKDRVLTPKRLENAIGAKDWQYAYGKYTGTDHRLNVGIERNEFVIPIDGQVRPRRRKRFMSRS